ncbi:tRNA epoxyqueuosine(34) reductase QueG [Methylovirgula sp. HY1]|uniref:tRNA epoxyqueuosine(34) reductase QueG n=1 Tax=Methylovirgula sp. HY1 TaxID=2822761 RepID=UPI00351CBE4A
MPQAAERLDAWLAAGYAGDMDYMAETKERRGTPLALWPDTKSIVMLGMNYAPAGDPLALLENRDAANISVYARHRDYHDVSKGKLKLLAGWLAAQAPGSAVKVFVDTAPVMEKPLAQSAGLGWAGKHTNVVSRRFGSWLFLGAIFTDLAIEPDAAEKDHCGSCQACLDICPTQAFPAPYRLDARRCISYLTIEHKGHIAPEFRQAIGNRVYGCDDCLAACPWNRFAQTAREAKLQPRADLQAPPIADWLRLDEAGFRRLFSGSPVKRIGFARFLRNLLIAAGNTRNAELLPLIEPHIDAPSALVRAMAVWAFGQLATNARLHDVAATRQHHETDPSVQAEWVLALKMEAPKRS